MIHIPVLLHEVIEILNLKAGDTVIDGTLGAGGHARELIKRISPGGKFLGVDRDENAVKNFTNSENSVTSHVIRANYGELPQIVKKLDLPKADALLLDLGFSSDQLTKGAFAGLSASGGKGFSFQSDEPLIMTYDDQTEPLSEQLKGLSEEQLTTILRELGEERYARQIAKSIWHATKQGKMETTKDLVAAVQESVPKNYEHGRIHPATRTFQALRIYANGELEHLKSILENLYDIVRPGRVAVISFHSLEDRIVKNMFKEYARGQRHSAETGELPNTGAHGATILTKKPITAGDAELAVNPRSRSAKLRAIQL